jgi:hypothetical protein
MRHMAYKQRLLLANANRVSVGELIHRKEQQPKSSVFFPPSTRRGLARVKIGYRLDAIEDLRQAAELFSEQGDTANYQQTLRTIKKLHKTLAIATSSQPLVSSEV